jgi:single-strand DNA-binding protein
MANFNFNKAIIGGRITDNPVLQTKEGRDPVTYFDVAILRKRGGKNGEDTVTDFPKIVAWGKNAEYVCNNFTKGSTVCVVGNIRTRSYTKDGVKGFSTEIIADEVFLIDSKADKKEIMRRITDAEDFSEE